MGDNRKAILLRLWRNIEAVEFATLEWVYRFNNKRLLELLLEPFRYYKYGERTVHLNGCVEVEAAYYGASPGWSGQLVLVQWDQVHERLLSPKTDQLLREHLRQARGRHRIH